jgi:hypothetical protein
VPSCRDLRADETPVEKRALRRTFDTSLQLLTELAALELVYPGSTLGSISTLFVVEWQQTGEVCIERVTKTRNWQARKLALVVKGRQLTLLERSTTRQGKHPSERRRRARGGAQ